MELRIYCICGQKMKVSDNMFGRPGKCIACRQKIRIPMPEELPEGETEIYLKKHPEFLRKPSNRANAASSPAESFAASEEVSLEAIMEKVLPVDNCEPLRILLSFERKIQRQQVAMGNSDSGGAAAILKDFQDRVASLKTAVRDQCQQKLIEFAADLSDVQEQIAKTEVLIRSGQGEFKEQMNFMDRLRIHRDYLERWVQNLRGWLAISDPHEAGGYVNLPFDRIPQTTPVIEFVKEPDDVRNLLNPHMEMLRAALSQRDEVLQKIANMNYVSPSPDLSTMAIADMQADMDASKAHAETVIAFCRARLDQLGNDIAQDILCYQNEIEHNRRRFYNREIDDALYQMTERELIRARDDARNIGMLVTRALIAGGAQDIPHPRKTFLERITRPTVKQSSDTTLDALLAYAVSVLLGLGVFFPFLEGQTAMQAYQNILFQHESFLWLFLLPVPLAMLFSLLTLIPKQQTRGIIMNSLWLLLTLIALILLYASQYSRNLIAVSFWRDPTYWMFRPGMVTFILADIGILASAIAALYPLKKWRYLPFFSIILLMFLLSGLFVLSMTFRPVTTQFPTNPSIPSRQLAMPQDTDNNQQPFTSHPERRKPESHKENSTTLNHISSDSNDDVIPSSPDVEKTDDAGDEPVTPGTQLELRGSMMGNGKDPKFSIVLHVPATPPQSMDLTIDKKIIGSWKVREYNKDSKTVTIDNGEKLIILRPGVPTAVE